MARPIRVFISSTFRDMHAERAAITRLVFPELRSRCRRRGAEFIGVDLRWGVTEEETRRVGALTVCLREIDDCRPFFVGLLGDRYGFVPPPDEVPADFFETARDEAPTDVAVMRFLSAYERDDTVTPARYRLRRESLEWTDAQLEALTAFWESTGLPGAGLSITAREVLRGVFEDGYPSTRAFFYLRNSGIEQHPDFPPALVPAFVESDPMRRRRLQELKDRIERGTWTSERRYRAEYAGMSIDPALLPDDLTPFDRRSLADGIIAPREWPALSESLRRALAAHGTVALDGMEALAEQMLEDLWTAIEPELETAATPLDEAARERLFHERFLERQTAGVFGRLEDVHWMLTVLEPRTSGPRMGIQVLTGPAGSGKSTFMAACARAARDTWPDALVIPYFAGAAPGSSTPIAMLRSLCESLKQACRADVVISHDRRELRAQFDDLLARCAAAAPIILFIDALNQLAAESDAVNWIPWPLPAGVRLVISTLDGSSAAAALARRGDVEHVTLNPLAQADLRELARHFLAQHRKRLTDAQLEALLDPAARPDSALPLYVRVALEELSLFGDHATLTRRIAQLPPTLPQLFEQVLARLEHDHGETLTRCVCSWLCAARAGLFEHEVLDLLGRGGDYPRVRWTRLYRALEPYLTPFDEDDSMAGRLDFFHDQLRFAAFRRYFGMRDADDAPADRWRAAHRRLASRFRAVAWTDRSSTWSSMDARALRELPYHLTRGGWWRKLEDTMTDLDFVAASCAAGLTYDLIASYDEALEAVPEGREERERQRGADERLRAYWGALLEHARDPKSPVPDIERARPSAAPEAVAVTRLRAFGRFVSADADMLNRFGRQPWFCVQQARNSAADGPVAGAARAALESWPLTPTVLLRSPAQLDPWNPHEASLTVMGAGQIANSASIDMTFDGRRAIAAGDGGSLTVWDLETGELTASLRAGTNPDAIAGPVALSADGRHAYLSCWGDGVHGWDLENGHPVETPRDFPKGHLALSLDGRRAFVGERNVLTSWNLTTGRLIARVQAHTDEIRAVRISAACHRVVTASWDGLVRLWHGDGLEPDGALRGHNGRVMDVAITPDGHLGASAGIDGTVRLWDFNQSQCVGVLTHDADVYAVAITADGRLVVAGGMDRLVYVWDVETGTCLKKLGGHGDWISQLAITPDGRRALSSSEDGTLRWWDVTHGGSSAAAAPAPSAIAIAAEGARAVTSDWDGLVTVWNTDEGRVERTIETGSRGVRSLVLSPDADIAWSAGESKGARIWELNTGACARTIDASRRVWGLARWPDGRHVAVIEDEGFVTLHDLRSGDVVWRNGPYRYRYSNLSVSDDGRLMLLSEPDAGSHPILIEARTGEILREIEGDRGLLTRLGQIVTSHYGDVLRVWDAATGNMLYELKGHDPLIDKSGRTLFAGTDQDIVRWDLLSGDMLKPLDSVIRRPIPLALTAGESRLVAYGADRMIGVWSLDTRACMAVAPAYDAIMQAACSSRSIIVCTLSGNTWCFRADWALQKQRS